MQETRDMIMSLHPKWCSLILSGRKTREVRKRAPLQRTPFKVYLYCTKPNTDDPWELLEIHNHDNGKIYRGNGKIVGEATCVSITEYSRPFGNNVYGTCLSAKELDEYAGPNDKLSYMALEDPITYEKPKELSEFGLKHPPMSWQYVKDTNETDRGGVKP